MPSSIARLRAALRVARAHGRLLAAKASGERNGCLRAIDARFYNAHPGWWLDLLHPEFRALSEVIETRRRLEALKEWLTA